MSHEGACECCSTDDRSAPKTPGRMRCYCPVDDIVEIVSKKYSLQIVGFLGTNGPTRYGELEDRLGVTSPSTLADRLAELADAGLLERYSFDEVPPRVEYSLTPRGRELEERIQPLVEWAAEDGA